MKFESDLTFKFYSIMNYEFYYFKIKYQLNIHKHIEV